jgi:thiol-disulfide isomerase/thioredoxin
MGLKARLFVLFVSLGVGILPVRAQDNPSGITVKTIDIEGIRQLIRERKGKSLLLNVWATWCKPCVDEFPDLVKIRRSFADSLVDVIAVSVDYPDEIESKILPFLASQNAVFPLYVSTVKKEEELMDALDPSWTGGIPATFVYDQQGRRRAFLFGQKNFEVFKAEIDSTLGVR